MRVDAAYFAGPGAMPNGQWPELGARGAAPGTAHRTQQISARLRVAVCVVARRNLLGLKVWVCVGGTSKGGLGKVWASRVVGRRGRERQKSEAGFWHEKPLKRVSWLILQDTTEHVLYPDSELGP